MKESAYIRKQASGRKRLKVVKPEALDDAAYGKSYDGMVKACGHPMGGGCSCEFEIVHKVCGECVEDCKCEDPEVSYVGGPGGD